MQKYTDWVEYTHWRRIALQENSDSHKRAYKQAKATRECILPCIFSTSKASPIKHCQRQFCMYEHIKQMLDIKY